MKEKGIMTFEQALWVEYSEIDEKTGKRTLRKDTPKEIKEAYEEYLKSFSKEKPEAK